MSVEAVAQVVERVGLPVVLLGIGAALLWRTLGLVLGRLVEAYRERVEAAENDRDYFRARSTTADEVMIRLARELIDECRARRGAEL